MAPCTRSSVSAIILERQNGNANRATLAVARELVAYLIVVDRAQRNLLVVENEIRTAA